MNVHAEARVDRPLDDVVIETLVAQGVVDPHNQWYSNALSAIRALFGASQPARSPRQWERLTGIPRKNIYRWLKWVSFPTPTEWAVLSRLLWAQRTLCRYGRVRIAAEAAGFPDTFTYSNQMYRALQVRPSDVKHLTPEQFMVLWIERKRSRFGKPREDRHVCPLCQQDMPHAS